ncbi:MAG: L-threonylcarbamoyladenylate synthase [Acidimicrobiales bacterium]
MAPPSISLGDLEIDVAVARIVEALRGGGVVLLPTDTVYGLAAIPGDRVATEQLFALKGRTAETPLAVLCAEVGQAAELADPSVGPVLAAVGDRWWPGPLTLVVPRRAGLGLHLGEPDSTIGLRVPDHAVVRRVAAVVGPVAATSANRHGQPTPSNAADAAGMLGPGLALVVDGGELTASASTVIDATGDPWTILREGPVPAAEIVAAAHAWSHGDR